MYNANVSWTVMQNFLDELESQALISAVPERTGHKRYALTEKGIECLRTLLEAKNAVGRKRRRMNSRLSETRLLIFWLLESWLHKV